ncbi:MAG: peptide chain release factor N(5)-glutamine methyltransferase, partial [Actinomycetota bacterium]|nr:peptide chain release factor N(5)-glutamine methyltransferase [Actinomycetota bacterium]
DHDNEDAARQLLAASLRVTAEELDELGPAFEPKLRERERYLSFIARRAAGEPLPFLTGRIEFYGLDLQVKPGAFVPRPSSEFTVERAIKKLRRRRDPVVIDMCTGAGPIALAIASEVPSADVYGADIDEPGLRQGRANARRLGLDNVTLINSDMYGSLPASIKGSVDLITGHVPYVPQGEIDDLPAEVKDFEPLHTLTDYSDDGLTLIRTTIEEAPGWLKPGGWLLLEMSDDLTAKAKRFCRAAGLVDIELAHDEYKLSVVVEARKPR